MSLHGLGKIISLVFIWYAQTLEKNLSFSYSSLTIYNGGFLTSPIVGKYCGTLLPPSFISSSSEILIHFETDYVGSGIGFKLEYKFYNCNASNALIGNGFCNDETNHADCLYDGGDCCGSCILKDYCSECFCYQGDTDVEFNNTLVGNGVCNNETNTAECNFDGGDCCISNGGENCKYILCLCICLIFTVFPHIVSSLE